MRNASKHPVLIEHVAPQMRRAYDRIAPKYNRRPGEAPGWQKRLFERLMRLMPPGGRVLDLGCGVGVVLKMFDAKGFRTAGVDQSSEMVRFTRRRVPRATVFHRDMRNPGFTAGSFDAIVSRYAVFHVPEAEQPRVFGHMARLLKAGGHALFNVADAAHEYIGEHYGEWMYWSGASVPETFRRLRKSGLEVLWHKGLGPRFDHHTWILVRRKGIRKRLTR